MSGSSVKKIRVKVSTTSSFLEKCTSFEEVKEVLENRRKILFQKLPFALLLEILEYVDIEITLGIQSTRRVLKSLFGYFRLDRFRKGCLLWKSVEIWVFDNKIQPRKSIPWRGIKRVNFQSFNVSGLVEFFRSFETLKDQERFKDVNYCTFGSFRYGTDPNVDRSDSFQELMMKYSFFFGSLQNFVVFSNQTGGGVCSLNLAETMPNLRSFHLYQQNLKNERLQHLPISLHKLSLSSEGSEEELSKTLALAYLCNLKRLSIVGQREITRRFMSTLPKSLEFLQLQKCTFKTEVGFRNYTNLCEAIYYLGRSLKYFEIILFGPFCQNDFRKLKMNVLSRFQRLERLKISQLEIVVDVQKFQDVSVFPKLKTIDQKYCRNCCVQLFKLDSGAFIEQLENLEFFNFDENMGQQFWELLKNNGSKFSSLVSLNLKLPSSCCKDRKLHLEIFPSLMECVLFGNFELSTKSCESNLKNLTFVNNLCMKLEGSLQCIPILLRFLSIWLTPVNETELLERLKIMKYLEKFSLL